MPRIFETRVPAADEPHLIFTTPYATYFLNLRWTVLRPDGTRLGQYDTYEAALEAIGRD